MNDYLQKLCLVFLVLYIVLNVVFLLYFRNELSKKLTEQQTRQLIIDTLEVELPNWGTE